ncbi:hypothetical protein [Staphylococcus pseudintermedius]|uniref:hypothetical protein n=1 Tax=Staphylococcus pseudintermedius TaxID=283734 RepID=UPI001F4DED90|nr:hypothetical protein [Staphylococcus pseudintermedius]
MKINTSHHQFGYDEKPTGLVLGELVHFYDAFNREGYTMDIYILMGVTRLSIQSV